MNNKVTLSNNIQRNENLLSAAIDDEIVLLDPEQGNYYGLNTVATDIWHLLKKPKSVFTLCQELIEQYDVETELCQKEVLEHLTKLIEQKLITICI
jgi:hypothetical protein